MRECKCECVYVLVCGPRCAMPTRTPLLHFQKSDFLRHPLMGDLVDDKPYISEESMQLMKFHGSYQQDHREKRSFGAGKAYMFMMRTRQPAGAVTNQLYLAMDDLADKVHTFSRPPQIF